MIKLWCLCHGISMGSTRIIWLYCQRSIHLQCCQNHTFCCTHVYHILEFSDLWWRACRLHLGRMDFAKSFPEESLQRCDGGDLQKPHCYRLDWIIFHVSNTGTTFHWLMMLFCNMIEKEEWVKKLDMVLSFASNGS